MLMPDKRNDVFRLRVSLRDIEPPIWRLIDVPGSYTFWDLHVAIQDAMGWLDYHLHSFKPYPRTGPAVSIGIPDEEFADGTLPGWKVSMSEYLVGPGDALEYEYDFGDSWFHKVELAEIRAREPGIKYPLCVDGARACPPEDCGGAPGYYELLAVLANPLHAGHEDMVEWLKGHAKNYHPYDPDDFDRAAVRFSNPKRRFKIAFEHGLARR
jgi:hypothetical protein